MDAQQRILGLAAVRALPELVRTGLAAAGLLDARMLATLDDEEIAELGVLFEQAAGTELPPGDKLRGGLLLKAVVVEAQLAATQAHTAAWTVPAFDRASAQVQQEQQALLKVCRLEGKHITQAQPPVVGPPVRWATKRSFLLAQAGSSEAARSEVDAKERARWAINLFRLLVDMGAPSVEHVDVAGFGPLAATRKFARGLRPSTLRAKVRLIAKLSRWCRVTYDTPWFATPAMLEGYLCERADEPCGRTVFGAVCGAAAFMEKAAGFPESMELSGSPHIVSLVKELEVEVAIGKGKSKRKANQVLVTVLAGWEAVVMDDTQPQYVRAYAWLKCAEVWGSLRSDDTLGIDPHALVLDEEGLTMTLLRTKTTGPGKAIATLPVYIAHDAFVEEKNWLVTGVGIWKAIHIDRDYFVACPSDDLQRLVPVAASYMDRACMSRMLARMLKTEGGDVLLPLPCVSLFWTEHSPRATLPTWVATLGGTEELRGKLGRWKSSQSCTEGYSRQDRVIINRAQANAAMFIRQNKGVTAAEDHFGERAVLRALRLKIEDEVSQKATEDIITGLTFFGLPPSTSSASHFLEDYGRADFEQDPRAGHGEEVPPTVADDETASLEIGDMVDELPTNDEEGEALLRLTLGKAGLKIPDSLVVDSDSDEDGYRDVPAGYDYATSQSRKHGLRKLHRVGWCGRVPGADYRVHQTFQTPPLQSDYDSLCKQCWRHQGPESAPSSQRAESSGSASTSSSTREDKSVTNEEVWPEENIGGDNDNTEAVE